MALSVLKVTPTEVLELIWNHLLSDYLIKASITTL